MDGNLPSPLQSPSKKSRTGTSTRRSAAADLLKLPQMSPTQGASSPGIAHRQSSVKISAKHRRVVLGTEGPVDSQSLGQQIEMSRYKSKQKEVKPNKNFRYECKTPYKKEELRKTFEETKARTEKESALAIAGRAAANEQSAREDKFALLTKLYPDKEAISVAEAEEVRARAEKEAALSAAEKAAALEAKFKLEKKRIVKWVASYDRPLEDFIYPTLQLCEQSDNVSQSKHISHEVEFKNLKHRMKRHTSMMDTSTLGILSLLSVPITHFIILT